MATNRQVLQTSLKLISHTLQFVLGFILGVSLIGSVAVGAGYYYFNKKSATAPTKPVYKEETESKTEDNSTNTEESETIFEDVPLFPGESATAPAAPKIPNNAYYARVTWPQGLSLRDSPKLNGTRIGGVGYNAKILILEQSSDKKWQRIQIPSSKQEGWVKSGNTKRVPN